MKDPKRKWNKENEWQKTGQRERSPPKGTRRNEAVHHSLSQTQTTDIYDPMGSSCPGLTPAGQITKGGNHAERGNVR